MESHFNYCASSEKHLVNLGSYIVVQNLQEVVAIINLKNALTPFALDSAKKGVKENLFLTQYFNDFFCL